jgi:hypothetical protein
MRPVHVHPDAEGDLLRITAFVAELSVAAAEQFIRHFEKRLS